MHRWFLAVFSLNFCLSVGMFSFAHADVEGVLAHAFVAQVVQADAPELLDLLAQVDESEHGLTDGHADIPEFIHAMPRRAAGTSPSVYNTILPHDRGSPARASLQRPPIPGAAA